MRKIRKYSFYYDKNKNLFLKGRAATDAARSVYTEDLPDTGWVKFEDLSRLQQEKLAVLLLVSDEDIAKKQIIPGIGSIDCSKRSDDGSLLFIRLYF